jgi:hypothetical protein
LLIVGPDVTSGTAETELMERNPAAAAIRANFVKRMPIPFVAIIQSIQIAGHPESSTPSQ